MCGPFLSGPAENPGVDFLRRGRTDTNLSVNPSVDFLRRGRTDTNQRRKIMSKVIATSKAPAAVGPYSQAIQASEVTDIIFTSGQLGLIPETGTLPEGVEAQARQSLENLKAIVTEAGFKMSNVVKTTVFLADMNDFAKVNAIYAEYFADGALPARSAVQVGALPKGGLVEIEAICAR